MAVAISMINMKGGDGKATFTSQIAFEAAYNGKEVLVIVLDPRSNLCRSLLGTSSYVNMIERNHPTVAQIFDDYIPAGITPASSRKMNINDVIINGANEHDDPKPDLIMSRLALSRVLKNPTSKERRLAKAISQVQNRYDLILIDCAPTESILTDAAYFASRFVVVPVKPEFLATIGLPLLQKSISEFNLENEDNEIDILGLVMNDHSEYHDTKEKEAATIEIQKSLEENHWPILENQIFYSRSLPKAARTGLSLRHTKYARWDRVEQFNALKSEILGLVSLG